MSTVGFNVPFNTLYTVGHFRDDFFGSDDPTNSIIALKDNSQLTMSKANLTRLSSLKGEEKNVKKLI